MKLVSNFLFLIFLWAGAVEVYVPVIVNKITHNLNNFTQGLKVSENYLYESIGLYGKSQLIRYNFITNNKVEELFFEKKHVFFQKIFAEDIEVVGNFIYLLTWKKQKVFIFSKDLNFLDEKHLNREGWGIAYDGKYIITSDGSAELIYRNFKNLEVIRSLWVTYEGEKLSNINALEYAKGKIYANVWFDNNIYIISSKNGKVEGIIDCSKLVKDNLVASQNRKIYKKFKFYELKENVLNGIAYDYQKNFFYLTGKRWAYIYKVLFRKK